MTRWLTLTLAAILFACAFDPPNTGPGSGGNGHGKPGPQGSPVTIADGTLGQVGPGGLQVQCIYTSGICNPEQMLTYVKDRPSSGDGGSNAASAAQVGQFVTFAEASGTLAQLSKAHDDCIGNWPYTADPTVGGNYCRWTQYTNAIGFHANEIDNNYSGGPGGIVAYPVCTSGTSSIQKIYNQLQGDTLFTSNPEAMLQHQSGFSDVTHRLFVSGNSTCTGPPGSTSYPNTSLYWSNMTNTDYENWYQSYYSGVSFTIGAKTYNAQSPADYDKIWGWLEDIAGPSASSTMNCGSGQTPCGSIVNPSNTNENANDAAWVASHNTFYSFMTHKGSGAGQPFRWVSINGCSTNASRENVIEQESTYLASSQVYGCSFEQLIYGFGTHLTEPRGWDRYLNSMSQMLVDYPSANFLINDHESPDALFQPSLSGLTSTTTLTAGAKTVVSVSSGSIAGLQAGEPWSVDTAGNLDTNVVASFTPASGTCPCTITPSNNWAFNHGPGAYAVNATNNPNHGSGRILHTALVLLAWKSMRMISKQNEDDGQPNQNQILGVYPEQLLVPAVGDGFPTMSRFTVAYDANADTDHKAGNGCDTNDSWQALSTKADHGAVDLLVASFAAGAGCAGHVDYKGFPMGVYAREFDNMNYKGKPITTASPGLALGATFMAVIVNPSTTPYTVNCTTDLPRHTTNYHHQMGFTSFTEGNQEVLSGTSSPLTDNTANGGDMTFTTSWNCAGGAGTHDVPAEGAVILVN